LNLRKLALAFAALVLATGALADEQTLGVAVQSGAVVVSNPHQPLSSSVDRVVWSLSGAKLSFPKDGIKFTKPGAFTCARVDANTFQCDRQQYTKGEKHDYVVTVEDATNPLQPIQRRSPTIWIVDN
jgi:phosphate-selective porin